MHKNLKYATQKLWNTLSIHYIPLLPILLVFYCITKQNNIHRMSILNKFLNKQFKMGCQFGSKLKVHKKMVEKHHSSSTLPKTMSMEISINLKYLDNCCFKITLEDKLNHIFVTWLYVKRRSFKYSSPNSFSK